MRLEQSALFDVAAQEANHLIKPGRFVDWFRGATILCTCVAILAVDFAVFPSHFRKSSTYGASAQLVEFSGAVALRNTDQPCAQV